MTVIGSGTTAEEELVIVDAFILAQGLPPAWATGVETTCDGADAFGRAAPE